MHPKWNFLESRCYIHLWNLCRESRPQAALWENEHFGICNQGFALGNNEGTKDFLGR